MRGGSHPRDARGAQLRHSSHILNLVVGVDVVVVVVGDGDEYAPRRRFKMG
jgi:hypothetical protein